MFGAGQAKVFAQDFEQSLVRRKGHFDYLAIEREGDVSFLF
jgi:hypothetical protein